MLDTRPLASRTKRMNFFVLSHLVCGVDHEAPGKVLLCLVQLLEAAGAPWPAAASPQCLHHPRVCIITPVSTSSPPCPHHHPSVHITPVSAPPPCLNHPGVCIITPVSASPPWCLYHPCVHITPVSESPRCLHYPRVCLHPTCHPHPGISVSPHPLRRVPGTRFWSHPQHGGPHLFLISSAKTLFP